jgi:hypothetical protein
VDQLACEFTFRNDPPYEPQRDDDGDCYSVTDTGSFMKYGYEKNSTQKDAGETSASAKADSASGDAGEMSGWCHHGHVETESGKSEKISGHNQSQFVTTSGPSEETGSGYNHRHVVTESEAFGEMDELNNVMTESEESVYADKWVLSERSSSSGSGGDDIGGTSKSTTFERLQHESVKHLKEQE